MRRSSRACRRAGWAGGGGGGGPKRAWLRLALLSHAVGCSEPVKWTERPRRWARAAASSRTGSVCWPVMLTGTAGEAAASRHWMAWAQASRCQMTLTQPEETSTGLPSRMRRAMSVRTP